MITLITGLILLLISIPFLRQQFKGMYDDDAVFDIPKVLKVIAIFVAIGFVSALNPLEVQRIDAGNVGLKIDRVGNDKGIPVARPCKGWVFYNSWTTDVAEYSIRQQHAQYSKFSVPTKGGTPMDVAPSYNYALKPEKASEVYINLLKGGSFEQLKDTWLLTATTIAMKNATNEFPVDSIFNHQSVYQQAVEAEINKEVSKYFTVSQINPGQITPENMKGILDQKAKSIQEAQQAELSRITAVANAQTLIATARGDSAKAVIDASGRAEAIRREQAVLTPQYIEFIKWSHWDGALPTTSLGGNTSVLLSK